ncbi:hypothetical protein G7Y29_04500 [Corynebacterium qintianiae]|uniref:DUF559 domain-containing protein n=1 Tax=Corynebacterium qintianiae TaxID=2709392 RepID=A0A7T0PFM5_9CORY|nr:hypothetical protein [Corynebacterium qintianiae]QPK84045.1 hypothetical protein G7Y29_04500 [Corynebacterium qintianiae]
MTYSGDNSAEVALIHKLYKGCRTAVVTGPAALRLHGVATLDWVKKIDLVYRGRNRAKSRGKWRRAAHYRSGLLDDAHVTHRHGLRTTSVVMALFDTYRYHGRLPALISIESALFHIPWLTKAKLLTWAGALPQSPGVRGFRELIGYAAETSQSPLESWGRDSLLQASIPGLAKVEGQAEFRYTVGGEEKAGRIDLLLNEIVALELDGRIKTDGRYGEWAQVTAKERAREIGLMQSGKWVLRAGWDDVKSGRLVRMVSDCLKTLGCTGPGLHWAHEPAHIPGCRSPRSGHDATRAGAVGGARFEPCQRPG